MMRKGILLLLAVMVSMTCRAAAPDFAYPQTVSKQAEAALAKAIEKKDGVATVRALADLGLAQNAIGRDKLPAVVKRIEAVKAGERDSVTRALLCMLLADIYSDVYSSNSWVFNEREQPVLPLPENYEEWSGAQFKMKIGELCSEAMQASKAMQTKKLSDYASIINVDAEGLIYYPTLYDFAAGFTIGRREALCDYDNCLSALYLTTWPAFVAMPKIVPSSVEVAEILKTYSDWLEFHKDSELPLVNVDLQRLAFVKNALYSSLWSERSERMFNLYKEMYEKYSESESCCDILLAAADESGDIEINDAERRKWLVKELERAVSKFPSFHRIDCLKKFLVDFKRQEVNIDMSDVVAPQHEFEVAAKSCNMPEVTVDFYRVTVSDRTEDYYKIGSGVEKLIKSVSFKFKGEVPFFAEEKLKVSLPEPGYYIARVRGDSNEMRVKIIRCSLLAIGLQGVGKSSLMVLNPLTGTPVDGADVERIITNGRKGNSIAAVGKTDKNGFLIRDGYYDNYCYYAASKGGDVYSSPVGDYFGSKRGENKPMDVIQGFTDLTIYHPGDTVKFVGVAFRVKGLDKQPLAGREVNCVALMPNGQRMDTIKVVTDDFGRVSGKFVLPENGLTGQARVQFRMEETTGNVWFTVSDYKLPTFASKVTALLRDEPGKGDVTIKGTAESYTGVSVADARVKMELGSSNGWYRRGGNSDNFYSAETVTDRSGNFKIEIPATVFEYAPNPNGIFTARFTVTSGTGESRECVRTFTNGKALTLSASIPGSFEAAKPLTLAIKIEDGEQKSVVQPVDYAVVGENDSIYAKGRFMPDDAKIDFKDVPSGRYSIKFNTENAETLTLGTMVIYRLSDKHSPVKEVLWSPDEGKTLSVDKGRRCRVVIAAVASPTHVLYALQANGSDKLIEQKWIKLSEGMNEFEVRLPEGVADARANFFAMNEFKSSSVSVKLQNKALKRRFALMVESERDKLVPGSDETVRLRSLEVGTDSVGEQSALIVNMWNAALKGIDGLQLPNLTLNTEYGSMPYYNVYIGARGWNVALRYRVKDENKFKCVSLDEPSWQLYGRSFYQIFSSNLRSMRMMATSAGASPMMMKEMKVESTADLAVAEEAEDAVDGTLLEVVEQNSSADEGSQKMAAESGDDFAYRDVATPSAFFVPMLKTDSQGNCDFIFKVPNANAQWMFQALAYNNRMETARAERVFMATRPIMVQSNLPRFLRYGDRTVVRAAVSNKSDRSEEVSVVTEFFDIASGVVIQRNDTAVVLAPEETANVGVGFTAPSDRSFVGYRVKASTAEYADGEQQVLPLLPFVTPVVETEPFYMSPDSMRMSIKMPEMKGDAQVTLQFCENPAWYVVTALPGLQKGNPQTAIQAADMIFSASVARGILKKYPAVKEALRQWQEQPGDSVLCSMLEKNNDLKIMLLSNTPWMADAENDTERMERLSLLFNEKEIKLSIESGMKFLKKLHCAGEGWAWHPSWMEPSEWTTMQVLTVLGRLNKLGFMPVDKELRTMVSSGLDWLQAQNVKQWKKNRKNTFTNYVVIRDLWPEYAQNALGKQLTAATVQRIVADWKKYGIAGKAEAALILSVHGYKPVAKQILKSMNEYAVITPESGMYWPSVGDAMSGSVAELGVAANALEAYNALTPGCKEIDLIRHWLVVQKETRNWGSGSKVSDIIAVFLGCGSDWTVPAKGAVMTLNGKAVDVSVTDSRLGSYRTELNPSDASGAYLEVEKYGKTPAWGAVYARFNVLPTEVSAQGCDGLSIRKRMFKLVGTEWVETQNYKLGDRVRIQLIVKADRALDYVTITDDRAACFEPVEQLPGWLYSEGLGFYRENRDSATNMFVRNMPKGTYLLSYEMWANSSGDFASGLAKAQSQYAPQITAHSEGCVVAVVP